MVDSHDNDGLVSHAELMTYLVATGASHKVVSDTGAAKFVFSALDRNQDSAVDAGEFTSFFSSMAGMNDASPNATEVGPPAAVSQCPSPPAPPARVAAVAAWGLRARGAVRGTTRVAAVDAQVHLAVTNSPSEMRVMWVTQQHCDNTSAPVVMVGSAPGQYNKTVPGTSATYTIPPRWWGQFTGQIHNVSGFVWALPAPLAVTPVGVCRFCSRA